MAWKGKRFALETGGRRVLKRPNRRRPSKGVSRWESEEGVDEGERGFESRGAEKGKEEVWFGQ